jgi:hypothetical protein
MVASLSLIPMEIKLGNLFFSETIKGSVSKMAKYILLVLLA